jgi:PAS domain S-box-containing protein
MRWWPRSIRWQMLAGLLLLEILSIALFALVVMRQQNKELKERAHQRLTYEAGALASQSAEALARESPGWLDLSVRMKGEAPSIASAKVTDAAGNVLSISEGDKSKANLEPAERATIPMLTAGKAECLDLPHNRWECAKAIYVGNTMRGIAWVEFDERTLRDRFRALLYGMEIFGGIWVLASTALVLLMSRSIAQPLAVLHRGTRALMNKNDGNFPLPVTVKNEIGDLILAFNGMVASLDEQRAGLNDTLSLLDSMLAYAPIGLALFDRSCRLVRVNQVFAGITALPLSRHLGRTLADVLPQPIAQELKEAVQQVLDGEKPVQNLELSGQRGKPPQPWTWLVSAYPVRTTHQQVRWVGMVVLDATERKLSEEALRRTEKLAVTGRMAATIAHEINNPLEGITNLLFLLRNYSGLDATALNYVNMAEYELRRISEITQQTLRFYRQSTLPSRTPLRELLDSVLSLYHGRLNALGIQVVRDYDPEMSLFCFAGEIRQVVANLVGNAIDAASQGGRLEIRARQCNSGKDGAASGMRFTVADTGAGMEPEVRECIFEPFFTTKEVMGTGLGLWVSREIVLKHHGHIAVRSRSASRATQTGSTSGTVFRFFIPDDEKLAGNNARNAV